MHNLYENHIAITQTIKERIKDKKVVFPAYYGKLYNQLAQEYAIELTPEELLNAEMLNEKIIRHILTLNECAAEAIVAIESENKVLLQKILTEAQHLQEEVSVLQKIIYEDTLTKTFNRKWVDDTLLESDDISVRESGILVIVDLDDFKVVNDTYGHIAGDNLLVYFAQKLKETGARVIRYGGDEFILIFDDQKESKKEVEAKIQALHAHFKSVSFKIGVHSFYTSFSHGSCAFKKGMDIQSVIEKADKAMYAFKEQQH